MTKITYAFGALFLFACGTPVKSEPPPAEVAAAEVCDAETLEDREFCADDAYDAYVQCSMTCGGTGNSCETAVCPATCMSDFVASLETCDSAWPECDATRVTELRAPQPFQCLQERYECLSGAPSSCTDDDVDACDTLHHHCAEA